MENGDDWSRNNILTQGAGAIGKYMDIDRGILDELMKYKKLLGEIDGEDS